MRLFGFRSVLLSRDDARMTYLRADLIAAIEEITTECAVPRGSRALVIMTVGTTYGLAQYYSTESLETLRQRWQEVMGEATDGK